MFFGFFFLVQRMTQLKISFQEESIGFLLDSESWFENVEIQKKHNEAVLFP